MAESPITTFISYSRADSAFIDRLEADLRADGFDPWVDRNHLEGGADWARVIEQQIEQRETLVVALSPDAITSTWVRREIIFALNGGKHIIPIIAHPVERVPIDIVEKQYIDLSADYTSGLQELRIALLKTRSLPPPPKPVQAPQPLLSLPDVSDPLKGLVQIPAPPPEPNPDRNALFMQAQMALAHGNLDLAEALLSQIVEQEADFGNGLAREELAKVREQLLPVQIQRLRAMADDAHARGAFGQEVGALRALAARQPDDNNVANRLALAEDCQKWAWLYDNARGFAQARDAASATLALTQLWERAPYFGDPARIAPPGLTPPASLVLAGTNLNKQFPQGQVISKIQACDGPVGLLRWSPNGSSLISAIQSGATRRNTGIVGSSARSAQAASWGAKTTSDAADFAQWDANSWKRQRSLSQRVLDVAWSPDSKKFVMAGMDGKVETRRASDGGTELTFLHKCIGVHWTLDGQHILGLDSTTVLITWNTSTGAEVQSHALSQWGGPHSFSNSSWSISGYYLAVAQYMGPYGGHASIFVIANPHNLSQTQRSLMPVPEARPRSRGIFSRLVEYVEGTPSYTSPSIQRPSARDFVHVPLPDSWGACMAWARVGDYLAVDKSNNEFVVFGLPQRRDDLPYLRFTSGGHAGRVHALAWAPDGSRIASASDDGVRLWDATDGRLLFAYGEHQAPVTALDWSPDSTQIASGDTSGALHIWKA